MRHRLTPLIAGTLLAAATPLAAAEVRLIEAGIYCTSPRTGGSAPAPNTVSGVVNYIEGRPFDVASRVVPMRLDLGFGIRTTLEGDADIPVRMYMRHPPMGPDAATEGWYESTLHAGEVHTRSFTFDEPWEMVPGDWSMEIVADDEILLSVDFVVTDAPVPAVDAACSALFS